MNMNCILFAISSFVTLFGFSFILISFDKYFLINFIHNLFLLKANGECYELNSKSLVSEIVYEFINCLLFFLRKFSINQFSMAFLKPNFHPFG